MVPHDCATLSLYDQETNLFHVHFLEADKAGGPNFPETVIPFDDSAAGAAFRMREPVLIDQIDAAPFAAEAMKHLTGMGMNSGCWVPLINRERIIGALMIASRKEAAFTRHEADMLSQIAGQIATAVDNALAFRQIAELSDKLKQEKKYPRRRAKS